MFAYDGDRFLSELERLGPPSAMAFAALCAELLVRRFTPLAPIDPISTVPLDDLVERCWVAFEEWPGGTYSVRDELENIDYVLSDEADALDMGEYIISGIYYALKCTADGAAGYAELVAKNLYEAADYSVFANGDEKLGWSAEQLLQSEEVQSVLRVIWNGLSVLEEAAQSGQEAELVVTRLKGLARSEG